MSEPHAPSRQSHPHAFLRQVIDQVKKENFDLKLKVHFLEERLGQLAPDHIDMALKHNVNLKIEVQSQRVDIKKLKKVNADLEKEKEELHQQLETANELRQEFAALEADYDQLSNDNKELQRRLKNAPHPSSAQDQDTIFDLQQANDDLVDRVERLEQDLEATQHALQDAQNALNDADSRDDIQMGRGRRARLEGRVQELEEMNTRLEEAVEKLERDVQLQAEEIDRRMDEEERLQLALEDSERRREGEAIQRSQSVSALYEEAGAREYLEEVRPTDRALPSFVADIMTYLTRRKVCYKTESLPRNSNSTRVNATLFLFSKTSKTRLATTPFFPKRQTSCLVMFSISSKNVKNYRSGTSDSRMYVLSQFSACIAMLSSQ